VFKKSAATTQTWSVELKDKTHREYQWRAEYFLAAGGPPKTRNWQKSTEPTLLVPMVDLAHV
jgi:hypothetical protein